MLRVPCMHTIGVEQTMSTNYNLEVERLKKAYAFLDLRLARRLVRLYGTNAHGLLGLARSEADLGRRFGADLYEAEVRYLMEREWALSAEDVLWRRTKRGLRLSREEAAGLDAYMKSADAKAHSAAAE